MFNKLIYDLLAGTIEDLQKIAGEIKTNYSYHVDQEKMKEHATALHDLADLIWQPEDEK